MDNNARRVGKVRSGQAARPAGTYSGDRAAFDARAHARHQQRLCALGPILAHRARPGRLEWRIRSTAWATGASRKYRWAPHRHGGRWWSRLSASAATALVVLVENGPVHRRRGPRRQWHSWSLPTTALVATALVALVEHVEHGLRDVARVHRLLPLDTPQQRVPQPVLHANACPQGSVAPCRSTPLPPQQRAPQPVLHATGCPHPPGLHAARARAALLATPADAGPEGTKGDLTSSTRP